MRRQQVGRIVARVVECLDPGLERLALLVFGHKRQLALCVGWDGHGYLGEIQGGADAIQSLVLTGDVDGPVAAIKVSDLDGRYGIEGWPRRDPVFPGQPFASGEVAPVEGTPFPAGPGFLDVGTVQRAAPSQSRMGPARRTPGRLPPRLGVSPNGRRGRRIPKDACHRDTDQAGDT